ncbi:MAG: response regulator transcription factor [Deltaproteobacteria bacterium]|nr:response regulator transcription factor [Deltaproteobacteria bacterium]
MTTLLLVEDDESLGATLVERLERETYNVSWAHSLAQARELLQGTRVDLAILDIGLPDGSGFDLAKEIRARSRTPVVFLTAQNSAENRLEGYEIGADEFIPKPFHLKELLLRVQSVLSRRSIAREIKSGDIVVNFDSMSVTFPDGSVEYPAARDFKLLQLLVESSPNVVSREKVLKMIFPQTTSGEELPTERTIDNSILRLRQLLKRVDGDYIRSVRGIGYQWLAPGDSR